MLAVGKPSSRPRWSPLTTVPSTMKGAPRQRRAASMSPAATRARIRLEETVSPSTSTSGNNPRLELRAGSQHRRIALRPGAEAEVLADRDPLGAELARSGPSR